ncbi:MAG: energy transducer TonB [Candidatus Egerieousia sp.]|jgi:periplasmic protein TonB|nr:energy transducer TonB [Bacteroidales bacterium]MCI6917730.1 energy transducer TonB [bacterium]MDY2650690.1 energy transducer TonB [Candidatus Egerieousia sp.]MDD5963545.1 energy transducer TonB [bacterium]MDD7235969.1 energy transducer TonB [bacterium]
MEVKKSAKANLEDKKLLLREIGLVVALLVVLGAFQWSSKEKSTETLQADNFVVVEEEMVPITTDVPPPPPEAPKEPVVSDIIDIVDDDIKVDNTLLLSTEDEGLAITVKDYVAESTYVEEEIEEEVPFAIVEHKPKFQGGDQNDFTKWVFNNIVYPEIAKENGVQGRVILQFTVDKDGSVKNVKVLRGVDSSLDKEAVRVVSSSPKWEPGRQRDKPAKVTFVFPVIFQLR